MKICICTVPIRPTPTTFPPFGSMAIIHSLREEGQDVNFYNIDFFRYSELEIENYFKDNQFDIVGISAVVSTAYVYTKYLSKKIRQLSPNTVVIVGGNLAASAEILLTKCNVDICVVGDGEIIIKNILNCFTDGKLNYKLLENVKGVCLLDGSGKMQFTGYGDKPSASEISWPDYTILEQEGSVDYFIPKDSNTDYGNLESEPEDDGIRRGERQAMVLMTKGCVARCTFCHRWEKGFRARPVDQVIEHVKFLRDKYDVGFIHVADENFGSDRELSRELATRLGELNIRWRVQGVRSNTATKELLSHWKSNGCTYVEFGSESGSQKMLNIMEKKTTVQQNINALRWTSELGMGSIMQLIVGMPGETDETISETIDFVKEASDFLTLWKVMAPSELLSINFAQALPGTPLYEWARERGYIGRSIDDEEKYLIKISDTDAYAADHFINYTGYPMLKVLMWPWWIMAEVDAHHWPDKNKKELSIYEVFQYYLQIVLERVRAGYFSDSRLISALNILIKNNTDRVSDKKYDFISESGYFNVKKGLKFTPLLLNKYTRKHFFKILAVMVAIKQGKGIINTLKLMFEYIAWVVSGRNLGESVENLSLRKVVKILPSSNLNSDNHMLELRKGR